MTVKSVRGRRFYHLPFFIALLGSGHVKGARRAFMKLTPGVRCTDESSTLVIFTTRTSSAKLYSFGQIAKS